MLVLLCSRWGSLGRSATAFREHDSQNESHYISWVPVLLMSMVVVDKRKETTARELGERGTIPQIQYMKDDLQLLEGPSCRSWGRSG